MKTPKGKIRFSRKDHRQFFSTLNKRVNNYFKENNLRKTGNWRLYAKSIVLLALFIAPYVLILSLGLNQWIKLGLCFLTGLGMAGIGMNVMHEGNHGAFSHIPWINKLSGGVMYILAGSVFNWKVQHNILHHSFTNIQGHDEDIEAGTVLRFSNHTKWRRLHKYQHLYFIFLYGLMTLRWVITTDFIQLKRYLKLKLSYKKKTSEVREWIVLILSKFGYLSLWIVLPILVLNLAWWKILIGFFVMHYTAGLILSVVFQLAHVTQDMATPLPSETGTMKNTWAVHQLFTTGNFSPKSHIINWFTGGLNHQIEHHIFPYISHIHYSKIARIVKETAREFDLPYHEFKTFASAFKSHYNHLKALGKKPMPVEI